MSGENIVVCQDCLSIEKYSYEKHSGQIKCGCGGEFCGCDNCQNEPSLRIEKFLVLNGWKHDSSMEGCGKCYGHDSGKCGVDIMDDEIVLIDDTGDFLHIPKDYFALVGALIDYRQLCISFISGRNIK